MICWNNMRIFASCSCEYLRRTCLSCMVDFSLDPTALLVQFPITLLCFLLLPFSDVAFFSCGLNFIKQITVWLSVDDPSEFQIVDDGCTSMPHQKHSKTFSMLSGSSYDIANLGLYNFYAHSIVKKSIFHHR